MDRRLADFNGIMKETDEIYGNIARRLGLSDGEFWILYTLRTETEPLTQTQLGDVLHLPKQTIHSALKKLEVQGLVAMAYAHDRRSKRVRLTAQGEAFARDTVDRVLVMEQEALRGWSEEEHAALMELLRRYADRLRGQMDALG